MSWPEGATIGHLPMIYGPLGDYEAALRTARKGLESAKVNNDPLMEQRIDEHMGSIYLKLGKPEAALPYLRKSISLTPQTEATHLQVNALLSLGEAYTALGQFGKASATLEEGLATARRMGRPAAEAQALDLLGEFWLRRASFSKAKAYFEQSLAIAERIHLAEVTLAARRGLATLLIRTNHPEEAWRLLQPAIERMDALRGRIPTPDLRAHFVERNASAYEEAIEALSGIDQRQPKRGYDREALSVAERAKARVFLDLLSESKAKIRKGLSADQQRERQGLESQVSRRWRRWGRKIRSSTSGRRRKPRGNSRVGMSRCA
jgi:tetratricopeptide (TPR) repeat protein